MPIQFFVGATLGTLLRYRVDPDVQTVRLPGGEWHITARQRLIGDRYAAVRDTTAEDLLHLAIWSDAVRRDGGRPSAVIPYLPGARQDRRRPGEALSAKVYADIINGCRLARVVCLDPHSDVMPSTSRATPSAWR